MPLLDANGSTDRALRIRCRGEFADVALLFGDQTWAIHGSNPAELKSVTELPVAATVKLGGIRIEHRDADAVVMIGQGAYRTTWKGLTAGLQALVA